MTIAQQGISQRFRFGTDEVAEALRACDGSLRGAARRLRCTEQTVARYCREDRDLDAYRRALLEPDTYSRRTCDTSHRDIRGAVDALRELDALRAWHAGTDRIALGQGYSVDLVMLTGWADLEDAELEDLADAERGERWVLSYHARPLTPEYWSLRGALEAADRLLGGL